MAEISVIVPAHNAAGTIGRTLDALARLEFDGAAEIVIVDDGSTDGTAAVAEGRGFRVVSTGRQSGPAAARNAGMAATTAPLVAFTDADCRPKPGWLAAMRDALLGADIVSGPVTPDPSIDRGPFDRTLWLNEDSPRFETANLGVRRTVADELGGFEPFAPRENDSRPGLRPRVDEGHFGEDALFGWRAVRSGARTAFARDAHVHHAVFPRSARDFIAERWRARFFPTLLREVPEMRSKLPLRVFLSPRNALFDLAVAGVLAAGVKRAPWPLLAAIPYLRNVRRRSDLVLVAADAVTLAALLRGSAAARRLLL